MFGWRWKRLDRDSVLPRQPDRPVLPGQWGEGMSSHYDEAVILKTQFVDPSTGEPLTVARLWSVPLYSGTDAEEQLEEILTADGSNHVCLLRAMDRTLSRSTDTKEMK